MAWHGGEGKEREERGEEGRGVMDQWGQIEKGSEQYVEKGARRPNVHFIVSRSEL